jgi:hypothetical protein
MGHGIKIPEHGSGSELHFLNNNKQVENQWEWKQNKQLNSEQNKWTINNE